MSRFDGTIRPPFRQWLAPLLIACFVPAWGETWLGLEVAPEHRCSEYDRADYRYPASVEPKILEAMGGEIRCRYTGESLNSLSETDIEHVVGLSEAHDSGLCAADDGIRREFARDLLNLTLAAPGVNRYEKGGRDAGEWMPRINRRWFAETVVAVKLKYSLTVDDRERDSLVVALGEIPTALPERSLGAVKEVSR